ncbi:MAG: hypothetical protein MZV70_11400 [Desulfobacterales bacterium]|nr:hypothetical protein [Desulfobacterales bacterium]
MPAFTQEKKPFIKVYYPLNNASINAPSTFFIGHVNPEAVLTINGNFFRSKKCILTERSLSMFFELKRGIDNINLKKASVKNNEQVLNYKINVPSNLKKTIPNTPLIIDKSSAQPDKNTALRAGDNIYVKFKGSTGNKALFFYRRC